MKIICIGGGPAGLYFSILLKLADSANEVIVHERNVPGRTHGWGVTYTADLLEKMAERDPVSAEAIRKGSKRWTDQLLTIGDRRRHYSGTGGSGIGRHLLLDILAKRAIELGVDLRYESDVDCDAPLPEADLIVACDGAGSALRRLYADHFEPEIVTGIAKYIWLGVETAFDAFTYAFVDTPAGKVWMYGYAYNETMSTCVVECSPETWSGLGFDTMDPDKCVPQLTEMFAGILDGKPMLRGESTWGNFRTLRNRHWYKDNIVLMGDSAHTAHFSIGSGTRLAFHDAMALTEWMKKSKDLPTALAGYETERLDALMQPQSEARVSAEWFENLSRYENLPDKEFFIILRERRSPLLARIPPRLYYALNWVSHNIPILRMARQWIGPKARAIYSRRETMKSAEAARTDDT